MREVFDGVVIASGYIFILSALWLLTALTLNKALTITVRLFSAIPVIYEYAMHRRQFKKYLQSRGG